LHGLRDGRASKTGGMNAGKILKALLLVQGVYTLITAVWPLLHIESFMMVTGPKTDIWLVKTVAVVLIPIALLFLLNRYINGPLLHVLVVAISSSIGLASIDFYYTANDTISWIYAVDGIMQVVFIFCWIYVASKLPLLADSQRS
jgi:hypothetical protein